MESCGSLTDTHAHATVYPFVVFPQVLREHGLYEARPRHRVVYVSRRTGVRVIANEDELVRRLRKTFGDEMVYFVPAVSIASVLRNAHHAHEVSTHAQQQHTVIDTPSYYIVCSRW